MYLEGDQAPLPVVMNGQGSFQVRFVNVKNPTEEFKLEMTMSRFNLMVQAPGTYQLTGMRDSYCEGLIVEQKHCEGIL